MAMYLIHPSLFVLFRTYGTLTVIVSLIHRPAPTSPLLGTVITLRLQYDIHTTSRQVRGRMDLLITFLELLKYTNDISYRKTHIIDPRVV